MENRLTRTATALDALRDGANTRLPLRQYEFLFEMTTQLLAAQRLDEQISLVLDTLTTGLGYPRAAVALIDKARGLVRARQAAGFRDDAEVSRLEFTLDSNAPQVRVVHEARPIWIRREGGDEAAA